MIARPLTALILPTALACALSATPALASPGACVENGAAQAYFFAAEARGGERLTAWLDPGQTLCSEAVTVPGGVVSVFESEHHEEGCSRLVAGADPEALLRYADFDRCRWSSHEN